MSAIRQTNASSRLPTDSWHFIQHGPLLRFVRRHVGDASSVVLHTRRPSILAAAANARSAVTRIV